MEMQIQVVKLIAPNANTTDCKGKVAVRIFQAAFQHSFISLIEDVKFLRD